MEFEEDDDTDSEQPDWKTCFRCGKIFLNYEECTKSGENQFPCSTEPNCIEAEYFSDDEAEEISRLPEENQEDEEEERNKERWESRPKFRNWLEDRCKHGNIHKMCFCFKAVSRTSFCRIDRDDEQQEEEEEH